MDEKQLVEYIRAKLEQYPELAEQYKEKKVKHLWMNIEVARRYETSGDFIDSCREDFSHAKEQTAEDLIISDYVSNYKLAMQRVALLSMLNEDDHYFMGVFHKTPYNIKCKQDYEFQKTGIEEVSQICERMQKHREDFVKIGKELHDEMLAEAEIEQQQYETNFEKVIQEMLESENSGVYNDASYIARIRVSDAFDLLGFADMKHRAPELIDGLLETHDPILVEEVMDDLVKNPTSTLVELSKYYNSESSLDTKNSRIGKWLGIVMTAGGLVAASSQVAQYIIDKSPSLVLFLFGAAEIAYGAHCISKYSGRQRYAKMQQRIILDCFDEIESIVEKHEKTSNLK